MIPDFALYITYRCIFVCVCIAIDSRMFDVNASRVDKCLFSYIGGQTLGERLRQDETGLDTEMPYFQCLY